MPPSNQQFFNSRNGLTGINGIKVIGITVISYVRTWVERKGKSLYALRITHLLSSSPIPFIPFIPVKGLNF